MNAMARAAVYEGPEKFSVREIPLPQVGSTEMLVEVILCGVDGSELHMFRGEFGWLNERAPVVFGDEIVGRVSAIGEDAKAARGLDIGDIVTVESRWSCNDCRTCNAGQYYLCEKRTVFDGYGTLPVSLAPGLWGGYATHVFVPDYALVYQVPKELDIKTALIACSPLANGIRWVDSGGTQAGQHVAVIGPGTQGLACALAAVKKGARVTVLGLAEDKERLAVAESFGATATIVISRSETSEQTIAAVHEAVGPVDVVIETAGAPSAKQLALQLVRPLGTLVNVSVTNPAEQPVNWLSLMQREITLVNPISHPHTIPQAFDLAVSLLKEGINVGDWITHTYGLDEAATAIAAAAYQLEDRPIKVALDPSL